MTDGSANIGANFSEYRGVPELGGGGYGVINIDTRPLHELAYYTMLYNKTLYDQRQKDTDLKVSQLADLSQISLNSLRGKDKEQATKEFTDLINYASESARKEPANQQEKMQQQLKWQTKYGAFLNNYNSGKQRALAYQAHLNTIKNNTTDAERQNVQIEQLDKSFDSTDIGTPISAMPQYKLEDIDVPKPIPQKFDVVSIDGDQNLTTKASIYNPIINAGNADATVLGLSKAYPQKGTPEYDQLSDNEKAQIDQQATVESQGKIWNDMTVPLNTAIKKYIDANGNFDSTKFETDNASNSTLVRAYNALKLYNNYNRSKYTDAVNGIFTDKGTSFKLPPNLNPNDFKAGFIDFSKGVSANQLVQAGIFSQYTGDEFTKTVQETGKAMQLKLERERQAGENYRKGLEIAKDKYIANLPYEKQKKGAIGANGQPIDFGNLLYGVSSNPGETIYIDKTDGTRINDLKINTGVVVDKKGNVIDYTGDLKIPASYINNSIITEFNKYAGSTKIAADGSVTTNAPSKLLIQNGKFTVRMVNGEIQGIQTEGVPDSNGNIQGGSFATADQFRHITLEAGQKGVTKYKKPDTQYGKFDTKTQSNAGMTDEEYNNFLKKNGLNK